jgi:hypothetical protein
LQKFLPRAAFFKAGNKADSCKEAVTSRMIQKCGEFSADRTND